MELTAEKRQLIERVLGRKISAEEKGNVESFAGFSDFDKDEFRILQEDNLVLEISYIRYRLKDDVRFDAVVSYAASVIQHGTDVEKWEKSYFQKI